MEKNRSPVSKAKKILDKFKTELSSEFDSSDSNFAISTNAREMSRKTAQTKQQNLINEKMQYDAKIK